MKNLITIALFALLCTPIFAQTNTDAIFEEAQSLNDIGTDYYDNYKYSKALEFYNKAAELTKNIDNGYNAYYAYTLNNLGMTYSVLGDNQKAIKYYEQSLEIKRKIYDVEDLSFASTLNNIAVSCIQMGDNEKALGYLLQSLKIKEKSLGKDDPNLATTWINIGSIYCDMADFDNGIKCYFIALEIRKKAFGEEHPKYADALNSIAITYNYIRDYQNALKYLTQALNIYKKTIGEETINYAHTLDILGTTYMGMKDYQNALKYSVQALDIIEKIFGLDSPQYAESLKSVGTICQDMGQYQNALKFLLYALKEEKKYKSYYPNTLNNIGNAYYEMGDYSNALKYYMQAKEMWGKALGETGTNYSNVLKNIGVTYSDMGDYPNAILTNKQAADILKKNLIKNFASMAAHEREYFWNSNKDYFYETRNYVYHAPDNTIATKTTYDCELITKGLLLASEISTSNIIKESGDSTLVLEYENMKKQQQQLNKELDKPIEERAFNCDSLENVIRKTEWLIMEKCKDYGDVTRFISIGWQDVQNSMKDNDVAIEFTDYTEKSGTKYMALVLTKNMEAPVCVPLFDKTEIQQLQRGIAPAKPDTPSEDENRGAFLVSSKRQGIYESTGLYNILWKPLEKYFPENPRIYFAPSGILHQIAIEYAPTGDGKLISNKYEMYRVSSTRFLALEYMPKQMKNTVLYGGINYDSDTTTMKRESDRYATRSANVNTFAAFNKDEERGSLNYLPGTKTEVEDIVGKLKNKNIKTSLYEGSNANEESFKALSGKDISILHIATHGFFLPSDEKLSGDQSLIQSGLLLSGANYAWQNRPLPEGIEDGILTAKEISYMDLRKTDLVVLSACQTALGEVTGEGVFGLQRGFKKAGARTIIMSLWPVDDNATLLMMTEFYSNLTNGMTKREAFLAAQNKVKTTAGFENPRYWAAFIMLDGNEN